MTLPIPPLKPTYPYNDGDVVVLGPEIFASKDGTVICWKGENYVPQPKKYDVTRDSWFWD